MNFGEVKSEVLLRVSASATSSPTVQQNVGKWVNMTVEDVCRRDRWWFLRTTKSVSTTAGTREVTVSTTDRIRYIVSASVGARRLVVVHQDSGEVLYPGSGSPRAVSPHPTDDTKVSVHPTPDALYTVHIEYVKTGFPALSADTDSNFLTDRYPEVVIHGATFHALLALQELQLAERYEREFHRYLQQLSEVNREFWRPGTVLAPGAARGPIPQPQASGG